MHEIREEGGPAEVALQDAATQEQHQQQSSSCCSAGGGQNELQVSTHGVCRLCLEEESIDKLISCCGCTGSIKYIHIRCLLQWQYTLWAQGQFSRALKCDICRQPYQQDYASHTAQLPLWQRMRQHWSHLYQSPEWALRVWRGCIVLGGLAAGTHRGVAGFGAGLNLGLRLARPLASFTFRLMPQLSVAAAVLPSLAPVLRNALRCSCSLMAMGVAATTAAGLLGGGVLGFCCGTVGVVRFTAKLSCHAAAVAAKVAAGFSRAALPRALALMLLKGGRVLQLHMLGQRKALQAPLA